MNDGDYAFFWGIFTGVFFTIIGQKIWASWGSVWLTWDVLGTVNNLLRGAS